MMKRLLILLLTSAVLAMCSNAYGQTVPSRQTLRQADSYLHQLHYDKALELYRSLSDAYDLSLSKEQRAVCLDAIPGCCDINMQQGNYPAAFENLILAEDIARGTIMSGSIDNRAGEVAYDLAEGCDPLVLTLHQFETKQVRALCVESGCGIAHMPVRLGYGAEPTLYMEGNIAQGIVYNTLSEEHLFLIKPHPFYSYSPSDQTPEYGNSAPFLAFTFIATEPSPAYTFPYPTNTSNAEFSYLENEEDITPPSLTMVQLRDKNGRIGNKFDNLSDIELYFNAADFHRTPPEANARSREKATAST